MGKYTTFRDLNPNGTIDISSVTAKFKKGKRRPMTLNWTLDDIYPSLNSPEFISDIEEYPKAISSLISFCTEKFSSYNSPEETLSEFLNRFNSLKKFSKLSMFVTLSLSTDTTNEDLLRMNDKITSIEVPLCEIDVLLMNYLKNFPNFTDFLNNTTDNIISSHKYYLTSIYDKAAHALEKSEELIIASLKKSGSVLWQKQWEQLTSTLEVEIFHNGEKKTVPLSEARSYAYSSDASLRKAAYEAELSSYKKIEKSAAFSLNGIKSQVITECSLRKYSSPFSMTAEDSRLKESTVNTMLSVIEEKLPIFTKYFRKKAELLGHSESLPFYDLFAPVGNSDIKFTYEQAQEFIIKVFSEFSAELADFAKNMFSSRHIDVMPHSGKVGGAFSEDIHSISQSRILTNFTGHFDDVVTLAHEIGHSYHSSLLYNESEINSFYPMPIAETASTFCETLIFNSAADILDDTAGTAVLETNISGTAQTIVDIYSRFIFEDTVFSRLKNGTLSCAELCRIMLDSQKKAYGSGLDENYLHPYMWACKPHYYDADFNYYNFPYAFGILLSKGLYALYMQERKNFVPLYKKLLSVTGKMSLEDVTMTAGIDITDRSFWLKSFDIIENEINAFLENNSTVI